MSLLDSAQKALVSIIPEEDGDPKIQYRWRLSVALLLLIAVFGQIGHIAIACGYLAGVGVSGFAYASDVQNLAVAQQRTEIRQIEKYLIDMQVAACKARATGKPTFYIYQQIREGEADYRDISGKNWVRPTCEDLGE